MADLMEKYISVIQIPELDKGLTPKNDRYFVFKNQPACLLGKRAHLQVSLIIAAFISSFFFKNDRVYLTACCVAFGLCLWYLYDSRYMKYYKRMIKAYSFSRDKQVLKNLNRLIDSKRVFISDMPQAYYVLKAKELLSNKDFMAAEYLADQMLKEKRNSIEGLYLKALCRYCKQDSIGAKHYFLLLSKRNDAPEYANCAQALMAEGM